MIEILKEGDIDPRVVFLREDGTIATNTIGTYGQTKEGAMCFWELIGQSQIGDIPTVRIEGKKTYRRIMIQRVYPNVIIKKSE